VTREIFQNASVSHYSVLNSWQQGLRCSLPAIRTKMTTDPQEPAFEQDVRRLSLRLRLLSSVRIGLICTSFWLFVFGVGVLALRASERAVTRAVVLVGIAGVVTSIAFAIVSAMRRTPQREQLRALLDRQNESGGLVMAAAQADLGRWRESVTQIAAPRLRLHAARRVLLLVVAFAFVAAGFLVPVRFGVDASPERLDIAKEVQQIEAAIETLKNEDIIDQSRVESEQRELDSIQSEASGSDPAKTWEALDRMNANLSDSAAEAAEKMAQASETLGRSKALAEALAEAGAAMDSRLQTEAMKELSRMAGDAASEGASFENALSDETRAALAAGQLNSKQLKELVSKLGLKLSDLEKRLARLRDANLIDLKTFKKCDGTGDIDSNGLAAFLSENGEDTSVAEVLSQWGKGGITRGRGDAPMTWSEGTREQGAKFKEQVIPPSRVAGLKDSQLLGRSVGAPTVERGGPASSGALRGAASGGGSALTQTILPRHKGAVQRYFQR
jgi:hypothetical protein